MVSALKTVAEIRLADTHGGLKRVAAILDKLDAHESGPREGGKGYGAAGTAG
jgi:hypothetical protein